MIILFPRLVILDCSRLLLSGSFSFLFSLLLVMTQDVGIFAIRRLLFHVLVFLRCMFVVSKSFFGVDWSCVLFRFF